MVPQIQWSFYVSFFYLFFHHFFVGLEIDFVKSVELLCFPKFAPVLHPFFLWIFQPGICLFCVFLCFAFCVCSFALVIWHFPKMLKILFYSAFFNYLLDFRLQLAFFLLFSLLLSSVCIFFCMSFGFSILNWWFFFVLALFPLGLIHLFFCFFSTIPTYFSTCCFVDLPSHHSVDPLNAPSFVLMPRRSSLPPTDAGAC